MAKDKDKEPMDLDDSQEPAEEVRMPAKDVDGIPYCRRHHCRMKQYSGGRGRTRYYSCPVPQCDEKSQAIKTDRPGVVPREPQKCPRCSRFEKGAVFCERDAERSTASMVILRCPTCGWKSNAMAVPQLAAAHFARRAPRQFPADIGGR